MARLRMAEAQVKLDKACRDNEAATARLNASIDRKTRIADDITREQDDATRSGRIPRQQLPTQISGVRPIPLPLAAKAR